MFSGRISNLFASTPARLTAAFLGIYIVGSLLIFTYLNYRLSNLLTEQIDKQLIDQKNLLGLQFKDYGLAGVRRTIENDVQANGADQRTYRVVNAKGKPVFEEGGMQLPNLDPSEEILEVVLPAKDENASPETARVISFTLPRKLTVYYAVSTRWRDQLKQGFVIAFLQAEVLIVLLGLGTGFWLSNRFRGRIDSFNQLAKRIVKSTDLSSRMPVKGSDEFAVLAMNVNAMLERIERLVQGLRQVSDNIAHDLRTPLTRLRADVEVALAQENAVEDRSALERVLVDLENMQSIINSMLSLGQAEAGGMRLKKRQVDLSNFLSEMLELYSPSAEDNGLELIGEVAEGLSIQADRQLLAQALSNLLDNALKYVPEGGTVRLTAARTIVGVEILIEDNGPGIPPEMREKIFERFTRVDPSRTLPGTGIGLALVKAFIELHHGTIETLDSSMGGAAFLIRLPLA